MRDPRPLINQAAISVLQTVISGVVLFLLYRFLIAELGTEQLGLWSVILATTTVARLADLGLTGSVVKFVAQHRVNQREYEASAVVQTAAISIALAMPVLAAGAYPLITLLLNAAIPATAIAEAWVILPWALLTLWFGSIGAVFQSGLDGCRRITVRNLLLIASNVLLFGAAYQLVPRYGLLGLAIGQAVQSFLLMSLCWIYLRRELGSLPIVPTQWSVSVFKQILRYSANFQASALAALLFEPITKLLISKFGGLSSVAFFEMANLLILKLRALIVSAHQALVPAVAELHATTKEGIQPLYHKVYKTVFFASALLYPTLIAGLPLVSNIWLGHIEPHLVLFSTILALGWWLNTLTVPAYFFNAGTGELGWNTVSHVTAGIGNLVLGYVFGSLYGDVGVVVSAMVSLVGSSALLVLAFHRKHQTPSGSLLPSEQLVLLPCVGAAASFSALSLALIWSDSLVVSLGSLAAYTAVVTVVTVFHPYTRSIRQLRTVAAR